MVVINRNLERIQRENTFLCVSQRIKNYKSKNKGQKIISLAIGDVSRPIVKPVIDAMHYAVDDLGKVETFQGYGGYYGYDFLKKKILDNEYKDNNFSLDEIYISNGTKTDSTSILELFDKNSKICITDPMYPIYRDGARSLDRDVEVLTLLEQDNFVLNPPKERYDIIYICSPNNPTGIAYSYEELKKWVDYAIENNSIILYDNVYESFIQSKNVPHSIYEINGAKKVAIEFRSFSKLASFTSVRCSYYIIPNEISKDINLIWKKRVINRFNGADYIAQKGAEAIYLKESKKEILNNIKYYMDNAKFLRKQLEMLDFKIWGGIDSPFIWVKIKENISSWELFDLYLKKLNIIVIPGIIFGDNGDKYFRISALGDRKEIEQAVERLVEYYAKEK